MKNILLLLFTLSSSALWAQKMLPVIKATSKKVAIKDGDYYDKNAWSLSPDTKPDIFTADRTRKTKWVTFYTDIDSIKVKVKPGTRFNFIVLLNGKDSCYTQIASAIPPQIPGPHKETHDTLPFTLTAVNAIYVKAIINDSDTLALHFDVGSFDFRLTKKAILKKTKLLNNQPAALAGKATPDFNRLNKVYKIQMGKLVWNNPEVIPTALTAHGMDGRFGWNLFEGKIVEINYDKGLLVIHSQLPKKMKGYSRSKLEFIHSFVCVKASIEIENKSYTGNFLFDTGSDQAIILDSNWVARKKFPKNLKVIKSSVLRDPRGITYETKTVLSPLLKIGSLATTNVYTYILGSRNPTGFEINFFGNDLLKRFNTLLDFKNDFLYLKPNKLLKKKYAGGS